MLALDKFILPALAPPALPATPLLELVTEALPLPPALEPVFTAPATFELPFALAVASMVVLAFEYMEAVEPTETLNEVSDAPNR
jgi:hypothetical protein